MKNQIYIFLLCFSFPGIFISPLQAQENFEGIITYSLLIESNNPTISSRQLQKMFGDSMKLFLKNGNYKMLFSGTYAQQIVYVGSENKHYISLGNIDSMMWRYCSQNGSSVIYTRALEHADYVLNYDCNAFCIQTDWGLTTYYYSPKLKLDASKYKNHVFNYFNVYANYAEAPYLKYVYNGPTFRMVLTATKVNPVSLSEAEFEPVWNPIAIK